MCWAYWCVLAAKGSRERVRGAMRIINTARKKRGTRRPQVYMLTASYKREGRCWFRRVHPNIEHLPRKHCAIKFTPVVPVASRQHTIHKLTLLR